MIRKLLGVIVIFVVISLGVSVYLSPDDLANCQEQPTKNQPACQAAEAIVVVSGGDTDARTDEATRLYEKKWAPLIIMSGAAADKRGPSNAAVMRYRAIKDEIPKEAVIAEESSETTKQNAIEVRQILRDRKIKNIILVTSGYHMRRAYLEFSANMPGVKIRAHPTKYDAKWVTVWWLTPWGWWLAVSELVKIGIFAIGGSR